MRIKEKETRLTLQEQDDDDDDDDEVILKYSHLICFCNQDILTAYRTTEEEMEGPTSS